MLSAALSFSLLYGIFAVRQGLGFGKAVFIADKCIPFGFFSARITACRL